MDRGAWQATVHGVTNSHTTKMTLHTHTGTREKVGRINEKMGINIYTLLYIK